MAARKVSFLSILFFAATVFSQDTINNAVVVSEVERTLDASSQLIKLIEIITLETAGGSSTSSFLYFIEPTLQDRLAHIDARVVGKDKASSRVLDVKETSVKGHEKSKVYRISLPSSLTGTSTDKIRVHSVYTHAQTPHPTEIGQQGHQLVQIKSNIYHYSPYQTRKQNLRVLLASSKIEAFSKEPKPVSDSGKEIKYGPYENIPAFTAAPLVLHFENNAPFLSVTNLARWIEVSHWGNIAFEDTVDIAHTGAKLKGTFSRLDYQRGLTTKASVAEFKTRLPISARDIYYRDEIGNISTSHVNKGKETVDVDVRPRFPLFGGWKTHYVLGYNVPSSDFLLKSGSNFVLQVRLIDHIYQNQVIDDATIKIILPEGASNIEIRAPFKLERLPDEKHYTYLDFVGRPVIVLKINNAVEEHIQPIQIKYAFDRFNLFYEPLLVIAAFALLFAFVIIYVRFDFSIMKSKRE
ncbi:dolichyl-diphosphooligosaccharide--protein glycosyltransferase subunit 1-like [Paramacrobiotus metropolitanus]|uniref:dolichyl-diphosphooligosaccharide--protein glycosyltransferase subunit 1-like n=1 Tax=Paramacrobiotus metropolitanus TaxID=2943436 RepID=UPI0024461EFC|nr:dolichyl-diphosphooligosaccharide--protein glycosyltransferase subunit 1-like [Paramacrobiotus metropolitanus]